MANILNIPNEQASSRVFNPNDHLIQIKSGQTSKDYLPVAWRLVWFRSVFPNGSIETEMIHLDLDRDTEEEVFVWNAERRRSEKVTKQAKGFCMFRATVRDGLGGMATGTKSEKAASFPDFIEKAETGAIGRALAGLGYGTQFTGDEFEEAHRIVDSPIERSNTASNNNTSSTNTTAPVIPVRNASQPNNAGSNEPTNATEQQMVSIRKLHEHLNKPAPDGLDNLSFQGARKMIQQLTAEYRDAKQRAS